MAIVQCMCQSPLSSVHTFKVVYLSKVSWQILMKFQVRHHQLGGKAALGFCADWI